MTADEFARKLNLTYGLNNPWPKLLIVDADTYAHCCQAAFDKAVPAEDYRLAFYVKLGPSRGLYFKSVELILEEEELMPKRQNTKAEFNHNETQYSNGAKAVRISVVCEICVKENVAKPSIAAWELHFKGRKLSMCNPHKSKLDDLQFYENMNMNNSAFQTWFDELKDK